MPVRLMILFFGLAVVVAAAAPLERYENPPPAPDFALQDLAGQTHALADYRGKIVIVNFWASWCAPCVLEMPSLQRAWEALRDEGVAVLGINLGESEKAVERFLKQTPVSFPLLLDRDLSVATAWSVNRALPVTFIVGQGGRMIFKAEGPREWDDQDLIAAIAGLQAD